MKNMTDGYKRLGILCVALGCLLWTAFVAYAGQEPYEINPRDLPQPSYDIDLRELRRTPPQKARKVRKPRPPRRAPAPAPLHAADGEETSIYTVRSGDHLFLILSSRYGLSDTATERLIPRVMRMNGIRNPYRLTIGQRLTIPLTPAGAEPARKNGETTPPPSPQPQARPDAGAPTTATGAATETTAPPPATAAPTLPGERPEPSLLPRLPAAVPEHPPLPAAPSPAPAVPQPAAQPPATTKAP